MALKLYYILNLNPSQSSDNALWWMPERRGYTVDLDKAGVYTAKEAAEIVKNRPLEDFAVEISVARAASRRVVDADWARQISRKGLS